MTRSTNRLRPSLEPLEDRLLLSTSSIRGALFADINGDGLRQNGEPGLAGRTVYLDLNRDGRLEPGEPRTTTAANGSYAFTGLTPGRYLVRQVVPLGWQATQFLASPALTETPDAGKLIGLDRFRADQRFTDIDGRGFSIVVIDTGIVSHPFFPPGEIVYQHNFVSGGALATDGSGHGTHVASIIGSRDPQVPGVAPGVQLIALKVLDNAGNGSFSNIEKALQWVLAHADQYHIIDVNLSFGDGGDYARHLSLYNIGDELAALASRNIMVVAAAGNQYGPDSHAPGVAYPAADPNVIPVGAVWDANHSGPWTWDGGASDFTTSADQIVSFSQRGGGLGELFAPGMLLNGAKPGGGTALASGTSEATAVVSGVVALAQQLARDRIGRLLSTSELRWLLSSTGVTIRDAGENDNVKHTSALFRRIDVMALAQAILDLGSVSPGRDPASREVDVLKGSVSGVNLGSFQQGRIEGVVFADLNRDGRRQAGEDGLTGLVVFADRNNNGKLDPGEVSAHTGSLGQFTLSGLGPGPVWLRVVPSFWEHQSTPVQQVLITSGLVRKGVQIGVRLPLLEHPDWSV
jgi:subtilisin family serine protease